MPIDYRDYPPDWHAISLRIRKERAGDKCETCGRANGSWWIKGRCPADRWEQAADEQTAMAYKEQGFKATKVVLTVAHIGAPKPDGSPGNKHDKHDVRDENLKAECQACHLRRDLNDHVDNRRYGLHHRRGQERLFP